LNFWKIQKMFNKHRKSVSICGKLWDYNKLWKKIIICGEK
jgi:hypothetical protein